MSPFALLRRRSHEPESGTDDSRTMLATVAQICERAASGDLEARITGIDPDDALAPMCHAINRILDVSDAFVREASAAMKSCSEGAFHRPILQRGLQGAYQQSAAVINSAGLTMKEDAERLDFVRRLAFENASSASSVAAACEELTATSSEISRQMGDSAKLTRQAVDQASQAAAAVQALNDAVRRVDDIVALIGKVAAQTNLLALNATIEAARAGEHGKGFLVVATEVKTLSRDTASATEEIVAQVQKMQATMRGVTQLIGGIRTSIEHMHDGSDAIERSVTEQVSATSEIARSIAEVSRNTTQVSERISARVA